MSRIARRAFMLTLCCRLGRRGEAVRSSGPRRQRGPCQPVRVAGPGYCGASQGVPVGTEVCHPPASCLQASLAIPVTWMCPRLGWAPRQEAAGAWRMPSAFRPNCRHTRDGLAAQRSPPHRAYSMVPLPGMRGNAATVKGMSKDDVVKLRFVDEAILFELAFAWSVGIVGTSRQRFRLGRRT